MGQVWDKMTDFFGSLNDLLKEFVDDLKKGGVLIGQVIQFVAKVLTLLEVFVDMVIEIFSNPEFYIDIFELLVIVSSFSFVLYQLNYIMGMTD